MDSERDSQMRRALIFFCIFMLCIFVIPRALDMDSVPFEVKLEQISRVLDSPNDVDFPKFPTISFDFSSPLAVIKTANSFYTFVARFLVWGVNVFRWFIGDVNKMYKVVQILIFNKVFYIQPVIGG